jgi:hypothetical protein
VIALNVGLIVLAIIAFAATVFLFVRKDPTEALFDGFGCFVVGPVEGFPSPNARTSRTRQSS